MGETLEELWLSYNQIEKLKGIGAMKKLRILTLSNNHVREWIEFQRLSEVPSLKELVFVGNPLEERCSSEGIWRSEVIRRLPGLIKLDGQQCFEAEVNLSDAQTELQKSSEGDAEEENRIESKFSADIDHTNDEEDRRVEEEEGGNDEDHPQDEEQVEQISKEDPDVQDTPAEDQTQSTIDKEEWSHCERILKGRRFESISQWLFFFRFTMIWCFEWLRNRFSMIWN